MGTAVQNYVFQNMSSQMAKKEIPEMLGITV
jgi:hypothetical protein